MSTARSKSVDVLLTEAGRIKDPVARLRKVASARVAHTGTSAALTLVTEKAIAEAREAGCTWPAIGEILGVSPQRAQQLARVSVEVTA